MRSKRTLGGVVFLVLMLTLAASLALAEGAAPIGTGFTYQGHLTDTSGPVNDLCNFTFKLYDQAGTGSPPTGGTLLGTAASSGVKVSDGLFTVQLDFGATAFSGDARWLQITVDCGSGTVTLSPRQELTPAPYALALPGLWTQQNATSPNLIGGYSGNSITAGVHGATVGGGGSAGYAHRVTGNYGTVGGGHDNEAGNRATVSGGVENDSSGDHASVSGGWKNVADGPYAAIGGGSHNSSDGEYTTIGGGIDNTASDVSATVGGGSNNTAVAYAATIGGGSWNTASAWKATIGGGRHNTASFTLATVSGGEDNTASDFCATIGGGFSNTASNKQATIGGGALNTASGFAATVGGGDSNGASGDWSTVPGGFNNEAMGAYSFAAGRRAKANNKGCFTWGDSFDDDVTCNVDNRWVARTSGGVYFYTNSALSSGVKVDAGGNAWSSVSDRNLKENFEELDYVGFLERLAEDVPITTWNYKSEDPSVRHIGPMAQDLYAAFGVGEDDKHISTVDADGVALAAIQGLYQLVQEKELQIADQQSQIADLEARLASLEALVSGMAQNETGGGQ